MILSFAGRVHGPEDITYAELTKMLRKILPSPQKSRRVHLRRDFLLFFLSYSFYKVNRFRKDFPFLFSIS